MALYTATQTGNWSAQSTWGGLGPPASGDTAVIGAFTVTVDVATTVGTSPNDTTTQVVTLAGTSTLIVGAGATFTVKGNIGAANGTLLQINGGGTLTFDNSGSGGSPIYNLINVGFGKLTLNGSVGNVATIQAISGQKWQPNAAFTTLTMTYGRVNRANNFVMTNNSGATSVTRTTFDSCGRFLLTPTSGTSDYIFDFNSFINGTDTTGTSGGQDLNIANNAYTSGTRRINGNMLMKTLVYSGVSYAITNNYVGESIEFTSTGRATSFTGNFLGQTVGHTNIPAYYGTTTVSSNYYAYGVGGNAHFMEARAAGGDLTVSGNVFEQTSTYAVDIGDAVFPYSDGSARTITVDNNLVIPISFPGDTNTSGVIVTAFGTDATRTIKARHNTIAGSNTATTGAINMAEGGTAHAGELAEWKSNLIWGGAGTANQRVASRIAGIINGIITAVGADYNFKWNTATGDNGRGYDDYGGNLNLWTGAAASTSDAANAGVDNNGRTADPMFLDPTRNLAKWCVARGYGAQTTSAALLALQADPTRIADLVSYVRAGFAPTNPVYKNAGHDGTTPGAVGWVSAGVGNQWLLWVN